MSLTRVGRNHQIVIPQDAVKALRLRVGDVLEGRVERDKLVLVPRKRAKTSAASVTSGRQEILARVTRKIERIRQDPAHTRGLTEEEAVVAACEGLIPADQGWWWTEQWQQGERQADRELKAGRTKAFTNVEDLIRDLRGR